MITSPETRKIHTRETDKKGGARLWGGEQKAKVQIPVQKNDMNSTCVSVSLCVCDFILFHLYLLLFLLRVFFMFFFLRFGLLDLFVVFPSSFVYLISYLL